tara:strand:- start:37 stop:612 length:576 start_codon:yes stop_codon:yes gene_type:complete
MTSAYAGGMIGIKAGMGTLDGERTSDAKFGTESASKDHEYGAIFAEFEVGNSISIGAEYIPYEATIDTKASANVDSHANLSDHKTLYVLYPFADMFYAKAGYSHADASVVANYVNTTVTDAPDSIEGPMIGIGAQFESPIPFLDVIRLEATYTDYGDMSITTTNANGTTDTDTKKGKATQTTYTIGIAKSF